MTRILLSAVALAAVSLVTACGGGDGAEDSAANRITPTGVADSGGIGGSGAMTQSVVVGSGGTTAPKVGGIGGSGAPAPLVGGIGGSGIESVRLAQACGLESVAVTIAGARVNADGAAEPGSPGWVEVAVAVPVRTDLLRLGSGEALPLDFSALPDGTYRQIRLLLLADDAAAPLANAVIVDGQETALAVPPAARGGLPLAATITIAQGKVTASLGALDACKAVSGTAGTYALDAAPSGATTQDATAY